MVRQDLRRVWQQAGKKWVWVSCWCMVFLCSVVLCPSASRASSHQSRPDDCVGSPGQSGFLVQGFRRETDRSLVASVKSQPR